MPTGLQRINNDNPNSGAGDSLWEAFNKVNNNFTYFEDVIPTLVADAVAEQNTTWTGGSVTDPSQFYGAVNVYDQTDSASPTTGALIVTGGLGVSGNVNLAGSVTAASATITSISSGSAEIESLVVGSLSLSDIDVPGTSTLSAVTADSVETDSLSSNTASISSLSVSTLEVNTGSSFTSANVAELNLGSSVVVTTGETVITGNVRFNTNADYGIQAAARIRANVVYGGTGEATSTSTGGLRSLGGAGIIGNLYVGGQAHLTGKLILNSGDAPTDPTDPGTQGEIAWDTNYFYVHTGSGWIRFPKDISWT